MDRGRTPRETGSDDLEATRRRLSLFVPSETYRPDLLARLARVCIELHDQAQAGRWWFLSDAAGPDVEAAVDAFVKTCQQTPRHIASELPRFKGDWEVEAYAPAAKARVARFGLADALAGRHPGGVPRRRPGLMAKLRRIFK